MKKLIKRAQLGAILDWMKHPIQHTSSAIEGIWPTKRDYKNTIYVDKNKQRLYYYNNDGDIIINSPVSTGAIPGPKQKEGDLRTPEGEFTISYSTDKADKNKFGDTLFYGLSYGHGIGIHGHANSPEKLGRPASHGCIRMPNGDLRCLQDQINTGVGTRVIIKKFGGLI